LATLLPHSDTQYLRDTLRPSTVRSGLIDVERFDHGGASLVDEVSGESTTHHLMFLHGWGGNRESLRGIATLFQHTHRVHLIDLPGFGEAPLPPADWDTVHYTDLVQQYLLERIHGSVILVGHSFGGKICIRLAARHLAPVRAMVLIGVPGLPQPTMSRVGVRRAGIRWLRRLLRALQPVIGSRGVDWHTKKFGSRDYLAAGELRSIFVRIVNEDLTESAQLIACPTLLLWGTDDTETPPWLGSRYKEIIGTRATLDWLPHKDHFPFNGTGAHLCGYRMREWMKDLGDV
jgi:pimeloyl-ACP methyl ester carboxylesterase